jgi:hypothetical protein
MSELLARESPSLQSGEDVNEAEKKRLQRSRAKDAKANQEGDPK